MSRLHRGRELLRVALGRTATSTVKTREIPVTMQCREVRELLDAFLGDQLLVETTNDLVRHLEGCPACRTELEGRRALRARLQSAFAGAVPLAPTPES
jgi:hypothetical protein